MRFGMFLVWAGLTLGGCGYTPASHYTKNVLGESVSTEVVISMEDPQNTVLIKDAVNLAVITKFKTALVAKNLSQTHLKISIASVSMIPLRYDTNGYVITYRAVVGMKIDRTAEGKNKTYMTSGNYDFAIEPNAIISDQLRFEAISKGAQKGIDAFVAHVAVEGMSSK
ncbi:MAG: hypothetical protein PHW64_04720 [Sulfuricurvum sp.]|nr:hypothetical protein [Sulfuricurvum sp.]